jgi:peptidyl-prolyl cis-trans isomerase C
VDTEEKAVEIFKEISEGKSFEDAAKEYSSCPSKANGGSLGDFGRGQMVPEFDTAVFEMEVGTVTETPVKTQFGYHLIKLNSKKESSTAAYEEVKESIKAALTQEKQQKAFESKINQLKIMYPVDIV